MYVLDKNFYMDSFNRGNVVITPDEIIFRAAEPYGDCSISFAEDGTVSYNSRGDNVLKFDSGKEVTATSNVSYTLNKLMSMLDVNATLDGLDSNSYAVSAEEIKEGIKKFRLGSYNFSIKDLRLPRKEHLNF